MLSTPRRASRGAAIRNGALALAGLLALAGPAWADAAADCRDRDRLSDEQRLPLCTAAIEAATDPRDRADLLLWRGAILDRNGEDDAALTDYAAAEALAPGWAEPIVERAWFHAVRGDMDSMVAELARALKTEPRSAYALQEAMNLLPDAGRWSDCLEIAEEAMEVVGDDPLTFAYRGRCKLDGGDSAGAVADFRQARAMGLDEAFLRSNFASALLDLDRPGEALKEARAAVALDPTHGHSQRTLVATLLATGDTDAALAAWRAADSQVVDGREVLANNIAWGLFEAGRAPEGLEILEGSLATSPEPVTSADAADTYGHLLAAASRPEEAVKAFLKAVDLGGPERQSLYEARLAGLGLLAGGDLAAALGACAATGSACRLAD